MVRGFVVRFWAGLVGCLVGIFRQPDQVFVLMIIIIKSIKAHSFQKPDQPDPDGKSAGFHAVFHGRVGFNLTEITRPFRHWNPTNWRPLGPSSPVAGRFGRIGQIGRVLVMIETL